MTSLEQQIFAAAYVDEYIRLHSRGVQPFKPGPRPTVAEWEAWCADVALDEAAGVVELYRAAARRAGHRARELALPRPRRRKR